MFHCEKVNCRARLFRIKVGLAMQYFFRSSIYVWIIKLELEVEASLNDDSAKLTLANIQLEPVRASDTMPRVRKTKRLRYCTDMCLLLYANL
jgi:hypothetical protein